MPVQRRQEGVEARCVVHTRAFAGGDVNIVGAVGELSQNTSLQAGTLLLCCSWWSSRTSPHPFAKKIGVQERQVGGRRRARGGSRVRKAGVLCVTRAGVCRDRSWRCGELSRTPLLFGWARESAGMRPNTTRSFIGLAVIHNTT